MKKNKKVIITSLLLGVATIPLITTTSCKSKTLITDFDELKLTINATSGISGTSLNSNNINDLIIKTWILSNKNSIFSDPDLVNENNLTITNLSFSGTNVIVDISVNNSSLGKLIITNVSNLENNNASTPVKPVPLPTEGEGSTETTNRPSASVSNPIDPTPTEPSLVLPPIQLDGATITSNKIIFKDGTQIVNPFTATFDIINKYGNFPLDISKSDSDITIEDLIKGFDLVNIFQIPNWSFGARNIDASKVAIAYSQWIISHWKYFPTYFQTNPASFFGLKGLDTAMPNTPEVINNTTWNVDRFNSVKWAMEYFYPTKERQEFLNFVATFLAGYDPSMTDIEKAAYAYTFVISWMTYAADEAYITSAITNHTGVCLEYAWLLSMCYNLIGLPSIAMSVGKTNWSNLPQGVTNYPKPHAVTWVYIDPYGTGKKWYVSDATFADALGSPGVNNGRATMGQFVGSAFDNFLFCNTEVSQFKVSNDLKTRRWQQSNYNNFYELPFGIVYQEKYKNKIGEAAIGSTSYKIKMYEEVNKLTRNMYDAYYVSKPQYFNGKYYVIGSTIGPDIDHFYVNKMYEVNFDGSWCKDVTDTFFTGLSQEVKQKILSKPMIYKLGNFFMFNEGDQRIRIHNMNDGYNWSNDKLIEIPQNKLPLVDNRIFDFYVDANGKIHITSNPTLNIVKDATLDSENIFQMLLPQVDSKYKPVVSSFFELTGGAFKLKLGRFDFGLTLDQKKQYYKDLKTLSSNPNLTIQDFAHQMQTKFNEFWKKCFVPTNKISLLQKVTQNVYTSLESFKAAGIKFDVEAWSDPESLINNHNVYRYNVYYSSNILSTNKTSFKLVAENLDTPRIKWNNINTCNPTGRYYVKAFLVNNPNISIDSSFIDVQLLNDWSNYENIYDSKLEILSSSDYIRGFTSNYSQKNTYWYNTSDIELNFKLYNNVDMYKNNIQIEYYHINKSTKQVQKIGEQLINQIQQNITFNKFLGNIDSSKHGIYYYKFKIIDKSTNQVLSTQFSRNTYLFTKNDVDNFNLNDWIALQNLIQ